MHLTFWGCTCHAFAPCVKMNFTVNFCDKGFVWYNFLNIGFFVTPNKLQGKTLTVKRDQRGTTTQGR